MSDKYPQYCLTSLVIGGRQRSEDMPCHSNRQATERLKIPGAGARAGWQLWPLLAGGKCASRPAERFGKKELTECMPFSRATPGGGV